MSNLLIHWIKLGYTVYFTYICQLYHQYRTTYHFLSQQRGLKFFYYKQLQCHNWWPDCCNSFYFYHHKDTPSKDKNLFLYEFNWTFVTVSQFERLECLENLGNLVNLVCLYSWDNGTAGKRGTRKKTKTALLHVGLQEFQQVHVPQMPSCR